MASVFRDRQLHATDPPRCHRRYYARATDCSPLPSRAHHRLRRRARSRALEPVLADDRQASHESRSPREPMGALRGRRAVSAGVVCSVTSCPAMLASAEPRSTKRAFETRAREPESAPQ
ncbi:hypothetical protein MTO96_048483 [Rhipicephalus appendiculatus]